MSNVRPFLDLLREHRNGVTHDELSDALQEIVEAVTAEGKAGKLTFTLAIKPHGDGAVMVVDEIKIAKPKPTKGGSLFFVTPDNNLERQDPRQRAMELRSIGDRPDAREIGTAPASVARNLA